MKLLHCFAVICFGVFVCGHSNSNMNEYCIVGAGPGGLQMGYFFQRNGWDYKIFERNGVPGSFFVTYPRHRKLISINKRHTGSDNPEFNLRHDWNSLLSDDGDLLFTKYSDLYFPPADRMLDYLHDYATKLDLNIQYNTDVQSIAYDSKSDGCRFNLRLMPADRHHCCKTLIMATGLSKLKHLNLTGGEYMETYDKISINPADYEGKSVLIIGKGNSAFETALSIYGVTNFVHMVSRGRIRLSWETHYVGDLRGLNNEMLDTYHLKSLDAIMEADATKFAITKGEDGLLHVMSTEGNLTMRDNSPLRRGYDKIIECVGFKWDCSVFEEGHPSTTSHPSGKYPVIKSDFESAKYPGLYFAGGMAHSLDFRKSSGGFIHGFRYTARALTKILARRNHDMGWDFKEYKLNQLPRVLLDRASDASAIYQMFNYLCDIAVLDLDSKTFQYYYEFPVKILKEFVYYAKLDEKREMLPTVIMCLNYGSNFSGPGKDVFHPDRAVVSPSVAHLSNFLHPWVHVFDHVPKSFNEATAVHHVLEDFTNRFDAPMTHMQPLQNFLNSTLLGSSFCDAHCKML